MTALVWFRRDLRLVDNPALTAAASSGFVCPVYIHDPASSAAVRPPGAASRWWLHQSLEALGGSLGSLVVRQGEALDVLTRLVRETGATQVFWNESRDPGQHRRDRLIAECLQAAGVDAQICASGNLVEPGKLLKGDGTPYRVFTPFYRKLARTEIAPPLPRPKFRLSDEIPRSESLRTLGLRPSNPDWADKWMGVWTPGEAGAQTGWREFSDSDLTSYAVGRGQLHPTRTSRLSAHLSFGEISPRQLWHELDRISEVGNISSSGSEAFRRELAWREFAADLTFHFPGMADSNWRREFDSYPWQYNTRLFQAWSRGQTGYPVVDAGMRQLWNTGFLHNRARMICASFLVKHLRIHWRQGETWFWDTLLDADFASNAVNWQWVAGSGPDAAPYFRIFNPVLQGEKFDPAGDYVRHWCPELGKLPGSQIHAPWTAKPDALHAAGVILGGNYPKPLVEHKHARQAALEGLKIMKAGRG